MIKFIIIFFLFVCRIMGGNSSPGSVLIADDDVANLLPGKILEVGLLGQLMKSNSIAGVEKMRYEDFFVQKKINYSKSNELEGRGSNAGGYVRYQLSNKYDVIFLLYYAYGPKNARTKEPQLLTMIETCSIVPHVEKKYGAIVGKSGYKLLRYTKENGINDVNYVKQSELDKMPE